MSRMSRRCKYANKSFWWQKNTLYFLLQHIVQVCCSWKGIVSASLGTKDGSEKTVYADLKALFCGWHKNPDSMLIVCSAFPQRLALEHLLIFHISANDTWYVGRNNKKNHYQKALLEAQSKTHLWQAQR